MAAGGGRDAVVGLDHAPLVGRDQIQVDDPEPGDLLRFALVEDLEVVRPEAAHGLAAASGDVHRHLDLEHERAVVELAQFVRPLRRPGRGAQEQAGQSDNPDSSRPATCRRTRLPAYGGPRSISAAYFLASSCVASSRSARSTWCFASSILPVAR